MLGVKTKDEFPEGMFLSAEEPVRSLRIQDFENDKLILVGGENHKTGQGKDTSIYYETFKTLRNKLFKWTVYLLDGLPGLYHIRRSALYRPAYIKTPNLYVATVLENGNDK